MHARGGRRDTDGAHFEYTGEREHTAAKSAACQLPAALPPPPVGRVPPAALPPLPSGQQVARRALAGVPQPSPVCRVQLSYMNLLWRLCLGCI